MESLSLSTYDFVVIGIIFLFVIRGIWLGLMKQIIVLLALYLGYFAASRYHEQLFPFLQDLSDDPKVVFLTAYVILFGATFLVTAIFGKLLSYVIQITITPWFDKVLGGVLGGAKALIVVVLLHMILGTLLAPENEMLRTCRTCPTLNQACDIARRIIRDEDIREALRQKEPAITLESVGDILGFPLDADGGYDGEQRGSTDSEQPVAIE